MRRWKAQRRVVLGPRGGRHVWVQEGGVAGVQMKDPFAKLDPEDHPLVFSRASCGRVLF